MRDAIGIDFGGTTIKSGRVREGRIIRRGEALITQNHANPASILAALGEVIADLRRGEDGPVEAIGIGVPGLVDSARGIVHELTNVPGWEDVALRSLVGERTGLPAIIENDANAMAYGEWKYGAARNGRDVVCVTLGTGVGGALILNGGIYRGAQMGAGEIGHVSIDYQGRPGPYGNAGALEEYVGNLQIAARAAARYRESGVERGVEVCTPMHLELLAREGDAIAAALWEEIGSEVGVALASVVWLLNPDTIVLGGGVAKAGELIFGPIRREILGRTQRIIHETLRIVPAELGNDAGIIGSAMLALAEPGS